MAAEGWPQTTADNFDIPFVANSKNGECVLFTKSTTAQGKVTFS